MGLRQIGVALDSAASQLIGSLKSGWVEMITVYRI
jgi:hypothetical protein